MGDCKFDVYLSNLKTTGEGCYKIVNNWIGIQKCICVMFTDILEVTDISVVKMRTWKA